MQAIQTMIERELGHLVMELLGERGTAELLAAAAEERALGVVRDIQAVLDDPGRSDFACVEEITGILARAGLTTGRHDFG